MLTDLTPNYAFTSGPAFIVGGYANVSEGDSVKVYVPSLLPEIDKSTEVVETVENTAQNTIFKNDNHPNFSGTVVSVNYVSATVSGGLVMRIANATLESLAQKTLMFIQYIPTVIELTAGTEVSANSDLDTFKDLYLT